MKEMPRFQDTSLGLVIPQYNKKYGFNTTQSVYQLTGSKTWLVIGLPTTNPFSLQLVLGLKTVFINFKLQLVASLISESPQSVVISTPLGHQRPSHRGRSMPCHPWLNIVNHSFPHTPPASYSHRSTFLVSFLMSPLSVMFIWFVIFHFLIVLNYSNLKTCFGMCEGGDDCISPCNSFWNPKFYNLLCIQNKAELKTELLLQKWIFQQENNNIYSAL